MMDDVLRLSAPDLQEDLDMIRLRLADELDIANRYGAKSWALFRGMLYELSRKGMRNRVALVFCAFALQNMSGAAAINYYSPTLFASIGISDVALYTGIYGLVKGEPLSRHGRPRYALPAYKRHPSYCVDRVLRVPH